MPLLMCCLKGQSWNRKFWPIENCTSSVVNWHLGLKNGILVLSFGYQKYVRSYLKLGIFVFLFVWVCFIVKYWYNVYCYEWRSYGNDFFFISFCVLLRYVQLESFSLKFALLFVRFPFQICLLNLKKNAWSKINVTYYQLGVRKWFLIHLKQTPLPHEWKHFNKPLFSANDACPSPQWLFCHRSEISLISEGSLSELGRGMET